MSVLRRVMVSSVLSLIPLVAFDLSLGVVGRNVGEPVYWSTMFDADTFLLWAVALPSFLPIVVAGRFWSRGAAVVVMTAAAVFAAASVVISDDAQAGFGIFWVGWISIPTTLVVVASDLIARWRRSRLCSSAAPATAAHRA